ncbi:MAG: DUF2062 domain-containing protein [Zoogloeaceae bacterium]|nr:DUF2062 domain-containing protein [Zoogloeaceae bacterium]
MIKRFMPTRESIVQSRLLRWLGPRIHDPALWHVNRNSVAKGVAIGAFFGFMVPVAQIPAAAFVALLARANLWVAAIATLVSNPFTYGPIYYFAYRLGNWIIPSSRVAAPPRLSEEGAITAMGWMLDRLDWLTGIGKPLVLGMLIMAIVSAGLGYFGVLLFWRINVILKRRRQRNARLAHQRVTRTP